MLDFRSRDFQLGSYVIFRSEILWQWQGWKSYDQISKMTTGSDVTNPKWWPQPAIEPHGHYKHGLSIHKFGEMYENFQQGTRAIMLYLEFLSRDFFFNLAHVWSTGGPTTCLKIKVNWYPYYMNVRRNSPLAQVNRNNVIWLPTSDWVGSTPRKLMAMLIIFSALDIGRHLPRWWTRSTSNLLTMQCIDQFLFHVCVTPEMSEPVLVIITLCTTQDMELTEMHP